MRTRLAILIPMLLGLSLLALPARVASAEDGAAAKGKPEKVEPHADDIVKKATARFEQDFAKDDMDDRLRILRWYGMHMHKTVRKRLAKIYLKPRPGEAQDLELQAAAADGLGNQLQDPKRAAATLFQGLGKFSKYATREDPEGDAETLQALEVTVLVKSFTSLAKLRVAPDKKNWKLIKKFIDHNDDDVTIAMLQWCGKTQEWRSLRVILDWFNFYPDGYSWAGGSVKVDTGAAGTKDAKAAKSKFNAKFGGRARKARPKAHAAMKQALKDITGRDFEKADDLKQWMKENKALLKKHGA